VNERQLKLREEEVQERNELRSALLAAEDEKVMGGMEYNRLKETNERLVSDAEELKEQVSQLLKNYSLHCLSFTMKSDRV